MQDKKQGENGDERAEGCVAKKICTAYCMQDKKQGENGSDKRAEGCVAEKIFTAHCMQDKVTIYTFNLSVSIDTRQKKVRTAVIS